MIEFPADIRDSLVPTYRGEVVYECVALRRAPSHREIRLHVSGLRRPALAARSGLRHAQGQGRRLLAAALRVPGAGRAQPQSLKGIFRFHELILPCVPPEDVIWLGEGHTPVIPANADLAAAVGAPFFIKYDGLNPRLLQGPRQWPRRFRTSTTRSGAGAPATSSDLRLTGDTSGRRALYLAYLPKGTVKSVVLLPAGKVTPQQLSQPLAAAPP